MKGHVLYGLGDYPHNFLDGALIAPPPPIMSPIRSGFTLRWTPRQNLKIDTTSVLASAAARFIKVDRVNK